MGKEQRVIATCFHTLQKPWRSFIILFSVNLFIHSLIFRGRFANCTDNAFRAREMEMEMTKHFSFEVGDETERMFSPLYFSRLLNAEELCDFLRLSMFHIFYF